MKYLFHLTTRKNAGKIRKYGLTPQVGENANRVREDRPPAVCLTDGLSLPYWRILLNCNCLLRVDTAGIDTDKLNKTAYSEYSELLYPEVIRTEYIQEVPLPPVSETAMRKLCREFFEAIQIACRQAALIHTCAGDPPEGYDELVEAYHTRLICITGCIKNLNFRVITQDEYRKILKSLAEDGEFTMTDGYRPCPRNPEPDRLWEMLDKYPMSPEKQLEQELFEFIKHTWTNKTLYIETGGWSLI